MPKFATGKQLPQPEFLYKTRTLFIKIPAEPQQSNSGKPDRHQRYIFYINYLRCEYLRREFFTDNRPHHLLAFAAS